MLDIRPSSAWATVTPVSGSVQNRGIVEALIWHEPGGTVRADTEAQVAASLRSAHAYYLAGQPGRPGGPFARMSYGYNWVIDRAGRIWTVRGADVTCGANGSTSWNARAVAVQIMQTTGQDPTPEQVDAARRFAAYLEDEVYHRPLRQLGHRNVRSQTWPRVNAGPGFTTSCPGAPLMRLLDQGALAAYRDPEPAVWPLDVAAMQAIKDAEKPVTHGFHTGFVVSYLQQVLVISCGQDVEISGTFEGRTVDAVKNVQAFFGLTVDGIVGPATWPVIDWICGADTLGKMQG